MDQETKNWLDLAETDLGVAVRYPNELGLEERHAKEALRITGEILAWVQSLIP